MIVSLLQFDDQVIHIAHNHIPNISLKIIVITH